ncbi:hypothetical protein DY000_02049288 [Brassica cretica]|uniref:Secreted protein n=1 Tax=Brassica cretica TaxID=69181 RepID=A0ABQ7ESX6_BRACR|nr:hypothetical protein DY000_02049288 [Brassica cretica]
MRVCVCVPYLLHCARVARANTDLNPCSKTRPSRRDSELDRGKERQFGDSNRWTAQHPRLSPCMLQDLTPSPSSQFMNPCSKTRPSRRDSELDRGKERQFGDSNRWTAQHPRLSP